MRGKRQNGTASPTGFGQGADRITYIPKADGRQRPLGIASLEDKIIQGALVKVLNCIYEVDFLEAQASPAVSLRNPSRLTIHLPLAAITARRVR